MENEIYKQLVLSGRQDLANQFLSMYNNKKKEEERLRNLEIFLSDVVFLLKSKKSSSFIVEKITGLVKKLCQ